MSKWSLSKTALKSVHKRDWTGIKILLWPELSHHRRYCHAEHSLSLSQLAAHRSFWPHLTGSQVEKVSIKYTRYKDGWIGGNSTPSTPQIPWVGLTVISGSFSYKITQFRIHRFTNNRDITIQMFDLLSHFWVAWTEIEKYDTLQSYRRPSSIILWSFKSVGLTVKAL